MQDLTPAALASELAQLKPVDVQYAAQFVDRVLAAALEAGASDVHLQPTPAGLEVRWRRDGVLQEVGTFPRGSVADVASRLKALAGLLTYRSDVPQEGRLRSDAAQDDNVEMRVSTFPTLHGERAVVRLFAAERTYFYLADLGLPAEVETGLQRRLAETSGALVISGPAGAGKTTTAYAALREIARATSGQRSLVSLEDPIEVAVPGVAQSQVNPAAGFDLATGLRSLLRQDPEVILVGEIRDRETAFTAFQAALTGHLLVTTFHAGGAATALSRLLEMGLEPYVLRSGLGGLVNQRLVRKLCKCARPATSVAERLGLPAERAHVAAGCPACWQTGYRGRLALAEMLPALEGDLACAVLERADAGQLHKVAVAGGMTTLFDRAVAAVTTGVTDPAEVRRVLGFFDGNASVRR